MGCGASSRSPESVEVEKQLKIAAKELAVTTKLLLLGAGESGKSTFAKQMRIVHLAGFTEEEREHFKEIIYENVIYTAKGLVEAVDGMGMSLEGPAIKAATKLSKIDLSTIPPEAVESLKVVFTDPSVVDVLENHYSQLHVLDSARFFISELDRISSPTYLPSVDDLLRCRAKTTGIQELHLDIKGNKFIIVDVGGQRSERKKWIHCFQDVTAVLFFVALSEYDLYLYEDEETNRMHESLKLFDEICNSKWFHALPIILFLNKKDLFQEKIRKVNITVAFPDYDGEMAYKECSDFIRDQFMALNENPQKEIFAHKTQATDTNNIKAVFEDVSEIVIGKALDEVGL
eukprot:TRINITY_DN2027_c0_g2_i1.p1 TRINITY_DN2027_c0_g2~~TRINITY_DN2027_c0_g2_i1.p1  ORF type:complete len:345 (-),score=72.13 TRINITY_DN2027_c0_g2_i1:150-1184(-)